MLHMIKIDFLSINNSHGQTVSRFRKIVFKKNCFINTIVEKLLGDNVKFDSTTQGDMMKYLMKVRRKRYGCFKLIPIRYN